MLHDAPSFVERFRVADFVKGCVALSGSNSPRLGQSMIHERDLVHEGPVASAFQVLVCMWVPSGHYYLAEIRYFSIIFKTLKSKNYY